MQLLFSPDARCTMLLLGGAACAVLRLRARSRHASGPRATRPDLSPGDADRSPWASARWSPGRSSAPGASCSARWSRPRLRIWSEPRDDRAAGAGALARGAVSAGCAACALAAARAAPPGSRLGSSRSPWRCSRRRRAARSPRTWPSTCCSGWWRRCCLALGAPGRLALARRAAAGARCCTRCRCGPRSGWAALTAVMLGTHFTGPLRARAARSVRACPRAPRVPGRRAAVLGPARRRRPAAAPARPGRPAGLAARGDAADGPRRRAAAHRRGRLSELPRPGRPAHGGGADVGRGLAADVGGARRRSSSPRCCARRPGSGGARRPRDAARARSRWRCATRAARRASRPGQAPRAVQSRPARPATAPTRAASPARARRWSSAGAAAADFYLQTGRMPLSHPERRAAAQPARLRRAGARRARRATSPRSARARRSPASHPATSHEGFEAFRDHCAGCHAISARGGVAPPGTAPALQQANARRRSPRPCASART